MSQCPLATPSLPTMEGLEQLLQDMPPSQLAATSLLRTAARVSWGWHRSWHWQEPEPSRATPTCSPWEPWPPRRRWSRARRRRTDWEQQHWEESPLHHLATVPASRATTPARCPPPVLCTPGKCELSRGKSHFKMLLSILVSGKDDCTTAWPLPIALHEIIVDMDGLLKTSSLILTKNKADAFTLSTHSFTL